MNKDKKKTATNKNKNKNTAVPATKKSGRKCKFETNVLPNLAKIEEWVKQGVMDKDIVKKIHLQTSAWYEYKRKGEEGIEPFKQLTDVYTRARTTPDENVENALYKSCLGYQYIEHTTEEKLDRFGNKVVCAKDVVRDVPPNYASIQFYLSNRMRTKWAKTPELLLNGNDGNESGVVEIPSVMPNEESK